MPLLKEGGRPDLEALAAQLGVKVTVGRRKKSLKVLKDDCDVTLGLREFLSPAKTKKTGQGKLSPLEQMRIQRAMENGRPGLEALATQLGVKVTAGRKKKYIRVLMDDCLHAWSRQGVPVTPQHDSEAVGEPTYPDAS